MGKGSSSGCHSLVAVDVGDLRRLGHSPLTDYLSHTETRENSVSKQAGILASHTRVTYREAIRVFAEDLVRLLSALLCWGSAKHAKNPVSHFGHQPWVSIMEHKSEIFTPKWNIP